MGDDARGFPSSADRLAHGPSLPEVTVSDGIDRPIFFLGPGRAGSTLAHDLVTLHPDVGYFVNWTNRFPSLSVLAATAFLRVHALEIHAPDWVPRGYPSPAEAYGIWKRCFPDFWSACRSPCADPVGAAELAGIIRNHLRFQRRTRFIAKLTGPCMGDFLRSQFPDAKLVWVDRDPRAVVYSYFLRSRKGSELPPDEKLRFSIRRYQEVAASRRAYGGGLISLRYEDVVSSPAATFAQLFEALELAHVPGTLRRIASWPIRREEDRKWERGLSQKHRELLCVQLAEEIEHYGASSAGATTVGPSGAPGRDADSARGALTD